MSLPKSAQHRTPASTILICEDEPPLRELMRLALGAGHSYVEAEAGDEGLALVRSHRPDAVVLDMMLPGMSGLDVLRALRDDPDLAATPVVAVSAWTHLEEEALAAGADRFLGKPFDPETLRASVEELLCTR